MKTIKVPNHMRLGDYHKTYGGVYAGVMRGAPGKPDYWLIAASSPGQNDNVIYGPRNCNVAEAKSDIDGLANTLALVNHAEIHPAAEWAYWLEIDGHSDFYLPACHELRLLHINVPDLLDKEKWYWSSTQYAGNSGLAWSQDLDSGHQLLNCKDYKGCARAVRRILIVD